MTYSALRVENCIARSAVTGARASTSGDGNAYTRTPAKTTGSPNRRMRRALVVSAKVRLTSRSAGGRVLCVCALGASVSEAQRHAYAGVAAIHWAHEFHRSDIGWRAIAREQGELGSE